MFLPSLVAFLWAVTSSACGSGPSSPSTSTSPPASSGTLEFRAAPLDEASIAIIIPLGNLNPPDHTLPTDHIYINNRRAGDGPMPAIPVYAPGDGTVQFILANGVESKIGIRNGSATYYLDHIVLDASIRQGQAVTSGQRLGTTGAVAYGIDLGVINDQRSVSFVNPQRYASESLHGDAPLRYFAEPLRSRLYEKVQRVGADRDGRFDYDVPGRLAGNWFLDGLPAAQSSAPSAWSQHLAFVFDNYDPSAIRVSIGGSLAAVGAFAVQQGAADPRDVTPDSGKITYRLLLAGPVGGSPGGQRALLIVQMLQADRIRVDVVASASALDADFSAGALIYTR